MNCPESQPPHKTRPKKRHKERDSRSQSIKILPVDNPISRPFWMLIALHWSDFCCFKKPDLLPAPFFPPRWISYSERSSVRMRPASLFAIQDASRLLLQQQQQLRLCHGNICSMRPLLVGNALQQYFSIPLVIFFSLSAQFKAISLRFSSHIKKIFSNVVPILLIS